MSRRNFDGYNSTWEGAGHARGDEFPLLPLGRCDGQRNLCVWLKDLQSNRRYGGGVISTTRDLHIQRKWLSPPPCALSLFFLSLSLSIVQQFTHVFRFQRFWRAAVVSQELCNLLPQAEREQSGEVSWLSATDSRFLFQIKFSSSGISYNWCPLQSGYCSSGGSSCSMSGLVSCVRKQNGSHLWTRENRFHSITLHRVSPLTRLNAARRCNAGLFCTSQPST